MKKATVNVLAEKSNPFFADYPEILVLLIEEFHLEGDLVGPHIDFDLEDTCHGLVDFAEKDPEGDAVALLRYGN